MKSTTDKHVIKKNIAPILQIEKFSWLPLFFIELVTLLFYLPSLNYPFQFDDVAHITKRFAIRFDNPLLRWWRNRRWFGDWINSLNFKIGEFDPFSYRLTNLCIHMATGALVYYLVLTLCKSIKNSLFDRYSYFIAFCTAGFFLLHPLQTQAVSYVIQARIEGVASFFILLNVLLFVKYVQATSAVSRIVIFGVLAFTSLISCGTKEIFVIAPLLMVLIDFIFFSQTSVTTMVKNHGKFYVTYGLYFGALIAWYIFDFRIFPTAGRAAGFQTSLNELLSNQNNLGNILTTDPDAQITSYLFFISQFKTIAHYFNLIFWPFSMSVEYDWMLVKNFMTSEVVLPLIQLLALAGLACYSIVKKTYVIAGFGLLWFFIVLAPRSSFIPSAELVCDYKSYLAVLGIFFALAFLLAVCIDHVQKRYAFFQKYSHPLHVYSAALLLVFMPLGTATYFRNTVWSSSILFWEDCVKKAPNKARSHNNYAVALCESGKYEQAVPHYEKAIMLDRFYQDPLSNLAVAYTMIGKHDQAVSALKQAIRLCPRYPEAYNNLASVYIDMQKYDEAEKSLETAISLRSYYGKAYFNKARICEVRNDYQGVFQNLKKAVEGDLDTSLDVHLKLGQAAFKIQNFDEAVKIFARVVKLDPTSTLGWFNYANAHYLGQNFVESSKIYARLVEQDPSDYRYTNNLAESLVALKAYDKALPLYEKLTKFEKFSADILFRIVECHEKMKDFEKAKTFLAQIPLEGTPDEFRGHIKHEIARLDLQLKLQQDGRVSLRDIQQFAASSKKEQAT